MAVFNFHRGLQNRCAAGFTIIAALACGLALAGCHKQPELTLEQIEGQHLYVVRCAHCHEDNDLALKPPPPKLQGVMRLGKLPSGVAATDQAVAHTVLAGKGKMPSFAGRFTDVQMRALIAYLRTEMPLPQS